MTDIAVIAGVLVLVAAVRHRLETLPVTAPMLFVAAGVVLGADVTGVLAIDLGSEAVALLAEFTLALILFSDASRIDVRRLRRSIGVPSRLLLVGLPLTIALGTVTTAMLLTDLTWVEAALVAAILAPTDAALGEAVVSNTAVPLRIRQSLNVESGLNDGLVVPAVTILLAVAVGHDIDGPASLAADAIGEIAIGIGVGAATAFVLAKLVTLAVQHRWTDAEGQRLIVLGGAVASFSAALALSGNGFIAAFVAGLLLRSFLGDMVGACTELAEDAGQLGATATFVVFGAVLVLPAFGDLTPLIALCAILTLTLGRMIPVWLSLLGTGFKRETSAFIGWFGPRGLASMVFGLVVIEEEELAGRGTLFSVIVIVITASVMLHGLTAAPLADRYGRWFAEMNDDAMDEAMKVEPAPMRGDRTD